MGQEKIKELAEKALDKFLGQTSYHLQLFANLSLSLTEKHPDLARHFFAGSPFQLAIFSRSVRAFILEFRDGFGRLSDCGSLGFF